MSNQSSITEFLSSVASRGRFILGIGTGPRDDTTSAEIADLCHKLLSSKGDASGIALSNEILSRYKLLSKDGKRALFYRLRDDFSADSNRVKSAAGSYLDDPSSKNLSELAAATEPPRRQLIIRLNQAPDATIQLLRMRADLLEAIQEESELSVVDNDFSKLFTSWFNGGFLQLRRLNWSSPASMLEKIMRYEAVHGMNDWLDLRARLAPSDREIYGFFHPRLGDEPLIFIEVALTKETPSRIQDVLGADRDILDPLDANTAVFYSISNCQSGLRGIPLGSFLIKRVVQDLRNVYPHLSQFVTLSPVSGYTRWIRELLLHIDPELQSASTDDLLVQLASLADLKWIANNEDISAKEDAVLASAICYFLESKNSNGFPSDAVARFHLGNGACLERINWPADTSSRALDSGYGIMVNYRYDLDDIETNHEKFSETGQVKMSPGLQKKSRSYKRKFDQLSRYKMSSV